MSTTRETIVSAIADMEDVQELGLPEGSVYSDNTLDAPTERPFIVVHWGNEQQSGVNGYTFRPFDVWGYDEMGSYDRIDSIVKLIRDNLVAMPSIATEDGNILEMNDKGAGQGKGADSYDDGFTALVKPWRLQAIARGL